MLEVLYEKQSLSREEEMKVVRRAFHPDDKVSLAPYIDFRKKNPKVERITMGFNWSVGVGADPKRIRHVQKADK